MLERIASHFRRLRDQFGRGVELGAHRYRVVGYHPSRLKHREPHEPFLDAVLRRVLGTRPGAVVDVGANAGQTLFKVLRIERTRQYVGFEPQIECCFSVHQFLRNNRLDNAIVLPLALSDTNGSVVLYADGECDEMASVVSPNDPTGAVRSQSTWIQTRVGDELLAELGVTQTCVIKIDVEGAELRVVSGLRETLRTQRPPVIFEVLPNFFGTERTMQPDAVRERNHATAKALLECFASVDYRVSQLDEHGEETPIERFDLDDRERFVGSNFIAHPRHVNARRTESRRG
jgi:FkbM family methyltransferase